MKKLDDATKEIIRKTRDILFDDQPFEVPDPLPGYYVYPFTPGFVVQMSISGTQHTLGYFNDRVTAARFADMATFRFAKYRKGPKRFNFSETQAKIDTMNEEESGGTLANFILAQLEASFQMDDLLHTQDEKPKLKLKRTGKPFNSRVVELEKLVANLESRITDLDGLLREKTDDFRSLESRIAKLEQGVTVFDCSPKQTPGEIFDGVETPKNEGAISLTHDTKPPTTLWTIETQNPPTK